jgi:molybdopterin synthase catalytic subunit
MNVNVLFFATLKDRAGAERLTVALPDAELTLETFKAALGVQYPPLTEALGTAVAAINHEFAFTSDVVRDGDEVAFFPPVSGGQPDADPAAGPAAPVPWPEVYRIEAGLLDLNTLTQAITTPATGAVCLFSGYVRGETAKEGKLTLTKRLEYEAYESMAVAKMKQVAAEIRERWPLVQGIAVVQRVGNLQVGEPTVIIACASGHRDQGCFEAARYGIDRLKEIVPIWKKEIGPDGQQWIEGHYTPTANDKR